MVQSLNDTHLALQAGPLPGISGPHVTGLRPKLYVRGCLLASVAACWCLRVGERAAGSFVGWQSFLLSWQMLVVSEMGACPVTRCLRTFPVPLPPSHPQAKVSRWSLKQRWLNIMSQSFHYTKRRWARSNQSLRQCFRNPLSWFWAVHMAWKRIQLRHRSLLCCV